MSEEKQLSTRQRQRLAPLVVVLSALAQWSGWLPSWAFYPIALLALTLLISSVIPHTGRRSAGSALVRSATLTALVVAVFLTALGAVDQFAARSDRAICLTAWAVFALLWTTGARLPRQS